MKKKVFLVILIILIICIITGSVIAVFKQNKEDTNLQEKTENEINYMNERIISIMNSLNNITFETAILKKTNETVTKKESSSGDIKSADSSGENSEDSKSSGSSGATSGNSNQNSNTNSDEQKVKVKYSLEKSSILLTNMNEIDWEYIKREFENIHTIWPNCIIDLYALNVQDQDILDFSNLLNIITINIKKEDRSASINNLAILYSYLPKYFEQFIKDDKKINLSKTKSYVVNTYALIEQNKWEDMQLQMQEAINSFSIIINNVQDANEYTENRISKTYILLNELNNSISLKDKELYYIKYKNVMEELIKL